MTTNHDTHPSPQPTATISSSAGTGKFPCPAFIEIEEAARITGIPLDVLFAANQKGHLGLYRDPDGECPGTYLTPRSLVIFARDLAPAPYRWEVKWMPLARILPEPGLQPRARVKRERVAKIATDLRAGEYVPPLVVRMRDDGTGLPLDGHRRLLGGGEAQAETMRVVCSSLPSNYDRVLALSLNQDQGDNVGEGECRALVVRYLREFPEVLQSHKDGHLSRFDLAVELGVSASSVFRAVQELAGHVRKRHDALAVVNELCAYLSNASPTTGQEAEMLIDHVCRVSIAIREGIPAEVRKDYRERRKLGVDRMADHLSPMLRQLVRRRGGDTTMKRGAQ